jgi:hypothetical protein
MDEITLGGPSISYLPKYLLSSITTFSICSFSRASSSIASRYLSPWRWRAAKVWNSEVRLLMVLAL